MSKMEELNCVITQFNQVSPNMLVIRVAPVGWEIGEFTPGQFAVLGLLPTNSRCESQQDEAQPPEPDKLIKRAYSVASSSRDKQFIEFYVSLVHSGTLTPRIFDLEVGSPIFMSTRCFGMFTIEDLQEDCNLVFIATGTGIAPYMSMLRSYVMHHQNRHFAVIHGAANSWDLGYSSELSMLQSVYKSMIYIPTITQPDREPAKWHGETRFVQDIWTSGMIEKAWGEKPTPDNTHVFLCGNPRMIDGMTVALEVDGFTEHTKKTPGTIHFEKFG